MTSPPHAHVEPCPSTLLQQHMADLLREGPDVAPSFLNSVLNQLNWAFSEFIGMIQEVGHGAGGSLWAMVLQKQVWPGHSLLSTHPPVDDSDPAGC